MLLGHIHKVLNAGEGTGTPILPIGWGPTLDIVFYHSNRKVTPIGCMNIGPYGKDGTQGFLQARQVIYLSYDLP